MQYYGIDLVSNNDEDSDDKVSDQVFEDLQVQITSNQQTMVQHDAINVPDFPSPFNSHAAYSLFEHALAQVQAEEIIPVGYGVSAEEIELMDYPTNETLKAGCRGRREMQIVLSIEIWYPRAV